MNEDFNKQQMQMFPDVDIQVFDETISETPIVTIVHAQPHELSALLATFRSTWRIEITGYYGESED